VSTALAFFKDPELRERLEGIQIDARLRVLNWMKAGKVAPGVLKIFEDTLYRLYKPVAAATDIDRELEAKFNAFKERNVGKTLYDAAKVVRDFMRWQHNFAEWEKPKDATDSQLNHAKRVERAFMWGATGMAAEGFSLPLHDGNLLLLNAVGYRGFGPGEVEDEVSKMSEAADEEARKNTRLELVAL
jgi:hypothetical protein